MAEGKTDQYPNESHESYHEYFLVRDITSSSIVSTSTRHMRPWNLPSLQIALCSYFPWNNKLSFSQGEIPLS
jgi:hypothetical protein